MNWKNFPVFSFSQVTCANGKKRKKKVKKRRKKWKKEKKKKRERKKQKKNKKHKNEITSEKRHTKKKIIKENSYIICVYRFYFPIEWIFKVTLQSNFIQYLWSENNNIDWRKFDIEHTNHCVCIFVFNWFIDSFFRKLIAFMIRCSNKSWSAIFHRLTCELCATSLQLKAKKKVNSISRKRVFILFDKIK